MQNQVAPKFLKHFSSSNRWAWKAIRQFPICLIVSNKSLSDYRVLSIEISHTSGGSFKWMYKRYI